MNRLFKKSGNMDDENLNNKIEKIFDNKLFQRIVEKTDVLDDPDVSASRSFFHGKNLLESGLMNENPSFLWRTEKPEKVGIGKNNEGNLINKNDKNEFKSGLKKEVENKEGPHLILDLKKDTLQNEAKKHFAHKNINGLFEKMNIKNLELLRPDLAHFKKKNKLDVSNITFTDRQKLNSDNSRNEILNDLTSKMQNELENCPSEISQNENETSYQKSEEISFFMNDFDSMDKLGYTIVEIDQADLEQGIIQLNEKYSLRKRLVQHKQVSQNKYLKPLPHEKVNVEDPHRVFLPLNVKLPISTDVFFPKKIDSTVFDVMQLKLIVDRERTGFEESKDFAIIIDSLIAGRYRVVEFLGGATFSKAIHVEDTCDGEHYCLKIIENNKDYFDQSIDEIKILSYINANCENDPDQNNIYHFFEAFYFKEHLFLVTELLKDNLYEYYRFNSEHEKEKYFTIPRIKNVAKQILKSLVFLHEINVIHCDLKPENIMVKSYSRAEFRLIDFGSACFIHDHLSSYVQSRFYRAPEIILGCYYDYKIDIWSLGCVLAEIYASKLLFQADSIVGVLARIIGLMGPIPDWMLKKGKTVSRFFTKDLLLFDSGNVERDNSESGDLSNGEKLKFLVPKMTRLRDTLEPEDTGFVDFLEILLKIDPNDRYTAKEALQHRWLKD